MYREKHPELRIAAYRKTPTVTEHATWTEKRSNDNFTIVQLTPSISRFLVHHAFKYFSHYFLCPLSSFFVCLPLYFRFTWCSHFFRFFRISLPNTNPISLNANLSNLQTTIDRYVKLSLHLIRGKSLLEKSLCLFVIIFGLLFQRMNKANIFVLLKL